MGLQETVDRIAKDEELIASLLIKNIAATTANTAALQTLAETVAKIAAAQPAGVEIDTTASDASLSAAETALASLTAAATDAGVPVEPAPSDSAGGTSTTDAAAA